MMGKLAGHWKVEGSILAVQNPPWDKPFVRITSDLRESITRYQRGERQTPTVKVVDLEEVNGVPQVLLGLSDREDRWYLTLFWCASHPRQVFQPNSSRGVDLLIKSPYGNAVVGIVGVDSLLVFRHRDYTERVTFDNGIPRRRVTKG